MVVLFDAHTHIGKWDTGENSFSREDLFDVLDKNAVEYFVVSNLNGIGIDSSKPDFTPFLPEKEANEELIRTFSHFPQAVLLAVCEPRHGSPRALEYLLKKHPGKFAGLKFHSEANRIPANSELYDGYMEIAKKHDLPCLFHSGSIKSAYSSPELIYELAQRHPEVRVILGHLSCGDLDSKIKAVEIMWESICQNNSQLYADFSWCQWNVLIEMIKIFANNLDRIMFGSDAPMGNMRDPEMYNAFANSLMDKIEETFPDCGDELIQLLFYENAKSLFKIRRIK